MLTKQQKISARVDGGPHFRVCAQETLRSAPHQHEQKVFGAHVCRVNLKHQKSYPKFCNTRTTFEITPLVRTKVSYCGEEGGVTAFLLGLESQYFCYLIAHAKYDNPFWDFSNGGEKKEEEKKINRLLERCHNHCFNF
jgi:hypothetical protein